MDEEKNIITRFTTPTLSIAFEDIDVSNITIADLTIKQDKLVIEKHKSSATVTPTSISWTLTQEETGQLVACRQGIARCDWVLQSGTRGISEKFIFDVENAGKNEVL